MAGEWIGIGFSVLLVLGFDHLFPEPQPVGIRWLNVGVMLLAGLVEGAALGGLQWRVLRRMFPQIPAKDWVGSTVAAALLGWLLGMLPMVIFGGDQPSSEAAPREPPRWLMVGGGALMGAVLGTLFGACQWWAFRRYAQHSGSWIWANTLGWTLAMSWIFLMASLPDADSPVALVITMGLAAGLLSGMSLGSITGRFLFKIGRRQSTASPSS